MRPAGFRGPNPFIRPRRRPGGQKLGLNLENIEPSNNHNKRLHDNFKWLQELRLALQVAESNGRWSKARKLRKAINECLEVELYIRHSWCGGCNNVLHNCICQVN